MQRGKKEGPDALRDASASALTVAVGRAHARTARRRGAAAAPPPRVGAIAPPPPAAARRIRTKLPPLPYGTRVTARPAGWQAAGTGGGSAAVGRRDEACDDEARGDDGDADDGDGDGDDDDDDDGDDAGEDEGEDDEDEWDDSIAADAAAAAAVSAALAAADAEAAAAKAAGDPSAANTKEEAAKKKAAVKMEKRLKLMLTRIRNGQLVCRYQVHVTLLCAMQLRMDAAASGEELQALALSVVPRDAILGPPSLGTAAEILRRFALWFRCTFQVLRLADGKPVRRKCSASERAADCIGARRGDLLDLVVLAAAALRASGVRCRIVTPMQPLPFRPPPASAKLKNMTGRAVASAVADHTKLAGLYAWLEVFVDHRWVHLDPVAGLVDAANEKDIGRAVRLVDTLSHGAASGGARAAPAASKRQKKAPVSALPPSTSRRTATMADIRARTRTRFVAEKVATSHVVAVENGVATDVTRRYVTAWQDVEKDRPPSGVFEKTIAKCCGMLSAGGRRKVEKLATGDSGYIFDGDGRLDAGGQSTAAPSAASTRVATGGSGASSPAGPGRRLEDLQSDGSPADTFTGCAADKAVDVAVASEQLEFDRRAMKEAVPKTLTALRNHPLYVVERHLRRYEAVYPQEPVLGYVGAEREPVYLRSHVRTLHTRDRWYREMRDVKADAVPIREVASKSKRDVEGAPMASNSRLFGEWQTVALVIPPVVNGIVPRGPRGNVEFWTPAHMPAGGVHVPLPHSGPVARELGVDFVPCMTGFDVRSGRSVPRLQGVVVAAAVADAVRDGALVAGQRASERAEERARADALAKWKDLLGRVKARQRIQQKYGGAPGDRAGGTHEEVQKRAGKRKHGPGGGAGPSTAAAGDSARALGDGEAAKNRGTDGVTGEEGAGKRRRAGSASEAHDHVFHAGRQHDGDVWIKVCRVCGIEVAFEKL